MSTRYHVRHLTGYHYGLPVEIARHQLHLSPRSCSWQRIERQSVRIEPEPAYRHTGADAFGNPVTRIELAAAHRRLEVTSDMVLVVGPRPWAGADVAGSAESAATGVAGPAWERVREALAYSASPIGEPVREALAMRFESPMVRVKRELEDFAAPSFAAGRPLLAAAMNLTTRIHAEFAYDPDATEVGTSVIEVLEKKRGVCQDFAHLMAGCLRATGLAARYVSGYLRTDPPEGQPRLVGADATHAWVAVFVPEVGWVEFDPTNGGLADERYIVLGWGRDFADVSPVRGVIQGGGEHALEVGVTVTPLDEEAAPWNDATA